VGLRPFSPPIANHRGRLAPSGLSAGTSAEATAVSRQVQRNSLPADSASRRERYGAAACITPVVAIFASFLVGRVRPSMRRILQLNFECPIHLSLGSSPSPLTSGPQLSSPRCAWRPCAAPGPSWPCTSGGRRAACACRGLPVPPAAVGLPHGKVPAIATAYATAKRDAARGIPPPGMTLTLLAPCRVRGEACASCTRATASPRFARCAPVAPRRTGSATGSATEKSTSGLTAPLPPRACPCEPMSRSRRPWRTSRRAAQSQRRPVARAT
jgi:hypothetical protein